MKKILGRLLLIIPAILIMSCSGNGDKKKNTSLLPVARGKTGEIILIMDSAQWAGPLGEAIKGVFLEVSPGLPQPESMFSLHQVNPGSMTSLLKQSKNLIYVTTLDNRSTANQEIRSTFTQASIERIKNDPELYMYTKENEFARGQEILFLFGQTEEQLIAQLTENKNKLQDNFNKVERDRMITSLDKGTKESGIMKSLMKEHGFKITIPMGYQLAMDSADFVWIRNPDQEVDKSIFITWMDYKSEKAFEKDSLLNLRERIGKKYIYANDRSDSYITTEDRVPVNSKQMSFNGKYAVELRGLWKLQRGFMGGPFLSYAFVDKATNRLYYIEGFLYSPGKRKVNSVRELESILWTFKTKDEF
ncbi:DUF4837 family protein [Xanthovirga aplysinae]|uniref:DUF4837 family protein n=1 Tax=Xanthovirga aplysinae TaxID=2529853 RepID=UPI001656AA3D|nr:DUF4837 family protein [Xanthovirga aplysinae]